MHDTASQALISELLDEERFHLSLTGDRETDQDIVRLSMIQCEEGLVRMAHALRNGDDAGWEQGAHRWRGWAEVLGFSRITGLLHGAEYTPMTVEAKSQTLAALHQGVEEIRQRLTGLGFTPPVVARPPGAEAGSRSETSLRGSNSDRETTA